MQKGYVAVLTAKKAERIRYHYRRGYSVAALSRTFEVPAYQIRQVIDGELLPESLP